MTYKLATQENVENREMFEFLTKSAAAEPNNYYVDNPNVFFNKVRSYINVWRKLSVVHTIDSANSTIPILTQLPAGTPAALARVEDVKVDLEIRHITLYTSKGYAHLVEGSSGHMQSQMVKKYNKLEEEKFFETVIAELGADIVNVSAANATGNTDFHVGAKQAVAGGAAAVPGKMSVLKIMKHCISKLGVKYNLDAKFIIGQNAYNNLLLEQSLSNGYLMDKLELNGHKIIVGSGINADMILFGDFEEACVVVEQGNATIQKCYDLTKPGVEFYTLAIASQIKVLDAKAIVGFKLVA